MRGKGGGEAEGGRSKRQGKDRWTGKQGRGAGAEGEGRQKRAGGTKGANHQILLEVPGNEAKNTEELVCSKHELLCCCLGFVPPRRHKKRSDKRKPGAERTGSFRSNSIASFYND